MSFPEEQGDHRLPFSDERFENGFEFLLEIIDKDSARILVDEPYAVYSDIYNDEIPDYRSLPNENSLFIDQLLLTNRSRESLTGIQYDSMVFNRSPLLFGKSSDPMFSNADWYFNDSTGILEIRLTWHLLNVTDPSTGCVLDNIKETTAIECTRTSGISLQAFVTNSANKKIYSIPKKNPHFHEWQTWEQPAFQQRLKPLYDSLQSCFKLIKYQPLPPSSSVQKEETFEICAYYKDYPKALSFRFEKEAYSQFEMVHPILKKYNKTATFNVAKEATQMPAGYAITSSGQRLKSLGSDEIAELRNAGHQIEIAKPSLANTILPASYLSTSSLLQMLEGKNTDWVVLQYEDLTPHSSNDKKNPKTGIHQISPYEFEKQLRLIRNSNYWIAPETDIFKYQNQRAQTIIQVNRHRQIQFVTLQTALNANDFDHPLSFYYFTQAPKIEVSGSEDDGFYQNRDGRILLNAKPGSEVTIKQIR